jgi:replicative DNA helicase Mcm
MAIPRELFRKYVAYAKQKIIPFLSEEAAAEIRKFYVELRNKPVASESAMRPIPISARQLQALIRMSEASAKLRLSKKVSVEDARIAVDIMKYYLMQVGYDYESKTFDIDRVSGTFSSSQRNKILTVRDAIIQLESKLGKMIPVEEIENVNAHGEIFKPRRGYVQKV